MGLAPAEVAAGVAELLAAHRLTAQAEHDGARQLFRMREVLIAVGPLPAERVSHALFHPRSLLVLEGEGHLDRDAQGCDPGEVPSRGWLTIFSLPRSDRT